MSLALTQLVGFGAGSNPTFAVWNSADKDADVVLSGSDLTATGPADTTYNGVRATLSLPTAGKVYLEYTCVTAALSGYGATRGAGNFDLTITTSAYPGSPQDSANNVGFFSTAGILKNDAVLFAGSFTNGDVINFAWDGATGKVWLGKAGTYLNSGNPAAGTGEVATLTGTQFPCVGLRGSASVTANFGASAFIHTVPSGFLPGLYTV
jgi:hypothetical protein